MIRILLPRSFLTICSVLFAALASGAQATIACTVSSTTKNGKGAGLFETPDEAAFILRLIPEGDLVFFPDQSLAPINTEGWAWVRHDETQTDIWQSGEVGWIDADNLTDCG